MQSLVKLNKAPKQTAVIIPLPPKYILLKDAYKYCGMDRTLFNSASAEYGLSVYARGPKKRWCKVEELDLMMESFKIIDRNKKALR